ncbi:MAG: DUF362 domain-containing protein [Candidatus Hecatellaceae archaeon]|nr:MAG: 4Fe-4S ferredoxin [Candidatus Hecatellales archaeon]
MGRLPEVFFFDERKHFDIMGGLEKLFEETGLAGLISRGDRVAVKVHMGELGNTTHIRPQFVAKIVELVKAAGGKPFVTDTTTIYPGERFTASAYLKTAAINGFTRQGLKAPIIIADGEKGYDGKSFPVKKRIRGCRLRKVEVASALLEADAVLIVSHGKGHLMTGFGGAIKHLAMGCTTKRSKTSQHATHGLVLNASKCTRCFECVKACPYSALEETVKGPPKRIVSKCAYCLTCLFNCPVNAYKIEKGGKTKFQVALAHAAVAVAEALPKGKTGYMNFLQDITLRCDCAAAGPPIVENIGLLASVDPVALDKASLDLIDKAKIITGRVEAKPPDVLGKLNRTNSLNHVEVASKLGLGSLKYRLAEVEIEEAEVEEE